jgi:hypothetical protein
LAHIENGLLCVLAFFKPSKSGFSARLIRWMAARVVIITFGFLVIGALRLLVPDKDVST